MDVQTSTTSIAQQLADAERRDVERLKQQGNGKTQIAFARDVKNSLLFQYDWGALLSAAPLAISLMGACYVAATSPLAQSISLKDAEPKDGFKFIRRPELKACLVQVSDTGRMAFLMAQRNMDLINSTSVSLGSYMSAILEYLPELPHLSAQLSLNNKIELLKAGSDDCLRYALEIEKEFHKWLQLVCELHLVTTAQEDITGQNQQNTKVKIAGLNVEAELTETSLHHATEAAKTLKQNLDSSRGLFEKAANDVPGPWESIVLSMVGNITSAATSIISQSLPLMMGPAGVAAVITGSMKGSGTAGSATPTSWQSTSRFNVFPPDSFDPAYPASKPISTILTMLVTLLGVETDKEVDWDSMRLSAGSSTPQGLIFMKTTLKYQLDHVQWTNGPPSVELKGIIENSIEIIEQLQSVLEKGNQIKAKKPDNKKIKKWKDAVADSKAKVTTMSTVADSFPGSAPGSGSTINMGQINQQANQDLTAQRAALSATAEKMHTTQAAYVAAQDNYAKASENALKVESELARIKANLEGLKAEKITMEGIKKILIQCIGTLIQMKTQINNLVQFFSALSAMIEHVVKQNVKDFVGQVESARQVYVAHISLLDITRQELYTASLMCMGYFSLFSTITKMYTKISVDHIMPGIKLCDELSKSDDENSEAIQQRTRALEIFSNEAQTAVKDIVSKMQKDTMSTLEERVDLVAKETKMLPKLPQALTEAIDIGKKRITEAVSEGIDNYKAPAVAASEASESINVDDI
ncbi:hypothetical protein K439DRAFT_860309 [Ramaria rubella]|nr:hypothetical protein K439DRAFT_860309 [Ramaria rubella]